MGNWAITIEGGGIHHNGPEVTGDADKMAKAFARALLEAGHSLLDARFTVRGGLDQSVMPTDLPLAASGYGKGYLQKAKPTPAPAVPPPA